MRTSHWLTGWAAIILLAAPLSAAHGQAASPDQPAKPAQASSPDQAANPDQSEGYTRTPAPADAYCYIGWPNDGETVRTTHIKVWFGVRNFGVAPAGTKVPNTGHYHLLIDVPLPPMDAPIPTDKNHIHFGLGQTETFIDLPPGTHTLQLLMGDGEHVPHNPPVMSKKITIHVRGSEQPVTSSD